MTTMHGALDERSTIDDRQGEDKQVGGDEFVLPFADRVQGSLLARLVPLARRGLASAYQPASATFPQTMRGKATPAGPRLSPEGNSPRYAVIAALGLARLSSEQQEEVLAGSNAAELARVMVRRARGSADTGLVALAAWAAAEVAGDYPVELFAELADRVARREPVPTVDLSWALTAAVAARELGPSEGLASAIAARLLAAQGLAGIFPHTLPPSSQQRFRRHIGCFADQVYPIQALSRWSLAGGGDSSLQAANRCAAAITARQGPQGQWWWHYDVRDGSVVEGFPVYAVHQHAMGPMALAELLAAGGDDHRAAVDLGLLWLTTHPEVIDELIADRLGVVWRKVGRRERLKAVRAVSAVTTSVRPGLRVPGIDVLCPPGLIDYECRPYELGWLLYTWADSPAARDE